MESSSPPISNLPEHHAAAWAVLIEPASSLLAPFLGVTDMWALPLSCKGLRPIRHQLCHVDHWSAGVRHALESGEVGPMVRRITARASAMEPGGAQRLAGILGRVPKLEELDLRNQMIGDEGAIVLAAALREHGLPHLHTLHLGFNFIGIAGVRALGAALFPPSMAPTPPPPPLRALQLEGNSLGPQGTTVLVDTMLAAAAPPQLAKLTLAQNRVMDEGAAALARLFTEWKGPGGCPIELLDLTSNHIGDAGIEALGSAIFGAGGGTAGAQRQHRLAVLDMMYNHVRLDGLLGLCHSLETALRGPGPSPAPCLQEANFVANDLTHRDTHVALHGAYPELIERGLLVVEEKAEARSPSTSAGTSSPSPPPQY